MKIKATLVTAALVLLAAASTKAQTLEEANGELATIAERSRLISETAEAYDGLEEQRIAIVASCRAAVSACRFDGDRYATPGTCLAATHSVTASFAGGERTLAAFHRQAVRLFSARRVDVLNTEEQGRIRKMYRRYAVSYRESRRVECGALMFRGREEGEFDAILERTMSRQADLREVLRVEYGDDFVRWIPR